MKDDFMEINFRSQKRSEIADDIELMWKLYNQ